MLIRYLGSHYQGWQRQSDADELRLPSVQATLESRLRKILNSPDLTVFGAGRTDAGVHALGQVLHFDGPEGLGGDLVERLNQMLPPDIAVRRLWQVPAQFHALKSAKWKVYKYLIDVSDPRDPFRASTHWRPLSKTSRLHPGLFVADLNCLASMAVGTHDFKSFQNVGTPLATTVRTLKSYHFELKPRGQIVATLVGDGFLKQMVRNLIGTTVEVALEKGAKPPETRIQRFERILTACDRSQALLTAPAEGLILFQVIYNYPRDLPKES